MHNITKYDMKQKETIILKLNMKKILMIHKHHSQNHSSDPEHMFSIIK